jgi:hypothetical protein
MLLALAYSYLVSLRKKRTKKRRNIKTCRKKNIKRSNAEEVS